MSGKFSCQFCAEFFDNESILQKRFTSAHGQVSKKVQCPKCGCAFSRKDTLKAHIRKRAPWRHFRVYLSSLSEVVFKFQQSSTVFDLDLTFWSWQMAQGKAPETSDIE